MRGKDKASKASDDCLERGQAVDETLANYIGYVTIGYCRDV